MSERLIDAVALLAQHAVDAPAVFDVREAGCSTWTWGRLWQQSGRIAALLLASGVRPGEAVAYQIPNWAEFVAVTLGVLRVGAVCCPMMPSFRERELEFMLRCARARVLFVADQFRGRRLAEEAAAFVPRLPQLEQVLVLAADADTTAGAARPLPGEGPGARWQQLDQALGQVEVDAARVEACAPAPGALAQLLFTSGTTGVPKGVLHRQDVLMRATALERERLHLGADDCIYVPSPLAHQTGFLYGMWLALSLGAPQILQERWEPQRGLWALRRFGGSFVQAATPFLVDLTEAVEHGAEPPGALRIFVVTGAAVPRAVARRATQVLRTSVCGAFGTTEGCLAALSSPDDPPEKAWGSDGRAMPSVQLRVCDERGRALPAGQEGLFEIRSPTQFAGYLDAPEDTARAYSADGWYKTGDLAVIDADGYLHVTGRVKDVINRGGEKIPVAQIEQLLHQHEAVQEVAIVAMPDARLVERACAFVALRAGRQLDLRAMQAFLDERRVAKQFWPERLEQLEMLPKTPSGKIQKFVLRERAAALVADRDTPGR